MGTKGLRILEMYFLPLIFVCVMFYFFVYSWMGVSNYNLKTVHTLKDLLYEHALFMTDEMIKEKQNLIEIHLDLKMHALKKGS